jgi:hypothetical protein
MFQWIKKGKIFTPQQVIGLDWLKEFAQAPSTLILDDVVRVYFSCRPLPDVNGQYVSHSAFVDLDRKNLYKIVRVSDQPILPMGDVGAFDEFGIYPVSVIKNQVTWPIMLDGHAVNPFLSMWRLAVLRVMMECILRK